MIISPYDTVACKFYKKQMDKIESGIKRAVISGETYHASYKERELPVMFIHNNDEIPVFNHPLTVTTATGNTVTVADGRAFMQQLRTGEYSIQQTPYNFNAIRGALQHKWTPGTAALYASCTIAPIRVFVRWMANTLCTRLSIPKECYGKISVLIGFYYLSLFTDKTKYGEEDFIRLSLQLSKAINISGSEIQNIIEHIPFVPAGIDDLAKLLRDYSDTVRTEKLTPAVIYQMMGTLWYGGSGYEITGVALEHPPTWLAMLWSAANEKGRFSFFGKMVQDWLKGSDLIETYSYNLLNII